LIALKAKLIIASYLLLATGLAAQQRTLQSLLEATEAQFFWDSSRSIGLLFKAGRTVTINTEAGFMLLNGQNSRAGISWQDGGLVFDAATAMRIERFLLNLSQHRVSVILIDAGHGGRDPGAIGRHPGFNVYEKDVTLAIALELARLLRARFPDKQILLTRNDDRFISLEDRIEIANRNAGRLAEGETEIYISIHANAAFNREARGFEVWRLPDSTIRHNLVNDDNLDPQTRQAISMVRNAEFLAESQILTAHLLRAMEDDLGNDTLNRGERVEEWFVVRGANMAAVLVEVGFVSNYEEARRLNDPTHLNLIARSLYTGLVNFVSYFEE